MPPRIINITLLIIILIVAGRSTVINNGESPRKKTYSPDENYFHMILRHHRHILIIDITRNYRYVLLLLYLVRC